MLLTVVEEGTVLCQQYRVVEKIGSGAAASVWTKLWLGMTNGDKEAFLQSTVEFGVDNIDDVATRRIVRRLTCKKPSERYDLHHLKVVHSL
jgi:hypothetical protein